MLTVTADDIRGLAKAPGTDPVLAVVDGEVDVVPAAEADPGTVVYTKAELLEELGEEVTDIEAETLAAGLTATLTG